MNILVIRQKGVGDLVMLSNGLIKLKEETGADISLATLPENISLMKGVWFLSDVFSLNEIPEREKFDVTIDLLMAVEHPDLYRKDGGRGKLDAERYVSENRVDVFEDLLGIKNKNEKKRFEVVVDQNACDKINSILKNPYRKKIFAIHAASPSSLRTIPPDYIDPLCDLIIKKLGGLVVLFGQTSRWSSCLLNIQKEGVLNLLDRLDLMETVALIQATDVIIGPDSGGIHLAGALDKSGLGLFGNIDPKLRTLYYPKVRTLFPEKELDCIPCNDIPNVCKEAKEASVGAPCMRLLTPERILNSLSEMMMTEPVGLKIKSGFKNNKKAIAYFSNGLGNFIMQMPAMAAVASMTDSKTIDICFNDEWRDGRRPAVEDICKAWPVVDRVISWPKDQINDGSYDFWFYSSHGSNCEVVHKFLGNMKHHPVTKPSWRPSLIHEVDHYMDIAYAMGYQGSIPKVEFPLADGPILDLPHPIVGICNGWFRNENVYWQKKGWPYFKQLAAVLRYYFGGAVVGIGGGGEIPSDAVVDANFGGKLSILQSAKVIKQLDLAITTDTGLMHLANIIDVPLIALFGSTLASKNSPRGRNSSVLMSEVSCAPCQDTSRFYNCQKFVCMEGITVGDVMAKAKEKLR